MKKDYIFNTIAGLINASEAVIMSMIITRTTGLTDAGYITIAFAVGNLLMTIGKYGVYSYQVTDHNSEFSFNTYLYSRIITITAMLTCLAAYMIYGNYCLGYNTDKLLIILFIGLIYTVETFEDLLKANCQYVGKLYIGALMFIIRWISIIISFGIVILTTHNTAVSLGVSFVISIIVFLICCYIFKQHTEIHHNSSIEEKHHDVHITSDLASVYTLLKACFPLFLSLFLSFYVVNTSKYAIDIFMDAKTQACFGFVAMPVFAIELLNSFIYQPQLVLMAEEFSGGNLKQFKSRIKKQYLIILLITATCLVIAFYIGIPFLSMLYHTDLTNYLIELLALLLGGGFLAVSGYQSAVLTIIRRQKYLLRGYIPVSIIALIFVNPTVKKYGTIGAAFSYLVLIIILCILYEIFILKGLAGDS